MEGKRMMECKMAKGRKMVKAAMVLFGVAAMVVVVAFGKTTDMAAQTNPANPVHHCTKDTDSIGNTDTTTWSYVYFGSYPQSEVTGSALTTDITGAAYDANGDAWVNGTKYRRISKSDANNTNYFGNATYRYFKWERIKWRVLKNYGSTLFVMADKGLDCKSYHDSGSSVTWNNCTLQKWLNNDFYKMAFRSRERSVILTRDLGNGYTSKIYPLSISEAQNTDYGFCEAYNANSSSRMVKASDYAHAMGANVSTSPNYAGNCNWMLLPSDTEHAVIVNDTGSINQSSGDVVDDAVACVPVLSIDLDLSPEPWSMTDDGTSGNVAPIVSGPLSMEVTQGTSATFSVTTSGGNPSNYTYQWYYASSARGDGRRISEATSPSYTTSSSGYYYYCVVSNGQYDIESDRAKLTVIKDESSSSSDLPEYPIHHCTGENDGSDYTNWSYVYFGSYPQTEVEGSALTSAIIGASYDTNGDAWVNGTKYRRISKSNTNNINYFGSSAYRYFKWERIKWRVLKEDGNTLFVMADKGLDCKDYHDSGGSATWESCTLRRWLNNDFYRTAFNSREQNAVLYRDVVNEDNSEYGTEGGNHTVDKVILLSISEILNTGYGFCETHNSVSRMVKASDYAHIRGAYIDTGANYAGSCWWRLRSPGRSADKAAEIRSYGDILYGGSRVDDNSVACTPVLSIDLDLASGLWSTTDDGTSGSGGSFGNTVPTVNGPLSRNVRQGTSATFSVTASGGNSSNYAYQWYYATSQSGAGTKISGATSSSYTISSNDMTSFLNGRYYYCVVSDGQFDILSDRAKLMVTGSGGSSSLDLPENPIHHCTGEDDGSDYTDWSYVYFGSYPQSRVTGNALTSAIAGAEYDENGDAWVNGTKYHKVSKTDGSNRYYKWERIKWRVLNKDDSSLLIMADKALDYKNYDSSRSVWEDSTLRSWLNVTFYNMAFSNREQEAILRRNNINEGNVDYEIAGGRTTKDNIFSLSMSEVKKSEYGFCTDGETHSMSRRLYASDYANRIGDDGGEICWWLRTPGNAFDQTVCINTDGSIEKEGAYVRTWKSNIACIPAISIDISSDTWNFTDDGSSGDGGRGSNAVLEGTCGESVSYEFNSSTGIMRIFGTGEMYNYWTLSFSEDKAVAPWRCAEYSSDIKKVVIENGVTHIGDNSFNSGIDEYFNKLGVLEIAETVTSIGEGAFYDCHNLNSVSMPDSVELIEGNAFYATSISNIHWSTSLISVGEHSFASTDLTEIDLPEQIQLVDCRAFSSCNRLIRIAIPDNCEVEGNAFYSCENLDSVEIGSNCKLKGHVFNECTNLKNVSIGEGTVNIYEGKLHQVVDGDAFYRCTGLQSIYLPNSWNLGLVGEKTICLFNGCTNIRDVQISDTNPKYRLIDGVVYSIDGQTVVYYPPGLTASEYEIPEGVSKIGAGAFSEQKYLENVIIPSSVRDIDINAFESCSKLNNVIIPDGIEELKPRVFASCENLKTVVLPKSVNKIDLNGKAVTETFSYRLSVVYGEENSYAQTIYPTAFKKIIYCNFDANGGIVDREKKAVIYNDKYRKLPSPVREGWDFIGWYTHQDSGDEITSNTLVTNEISHILYAHWKEKDSSSNKELSVTAPSSQSVKAGTSVTFGVTASGGHSTNYIYQWYYATSQSGAGMRISGATSSTYTIDANHVDISLNGRYYYCVVSNGQYEVESGRAKLTVKTDDTSEPVLPPGNNQTGGNQNTSGGSHTSSGLKTQTINAISRTVAYQKKAMFLGASTNGNGRLTYKSSNPKVVAVLPDGRIKIKNFGTAVITINASQTASYAAASKQITIEVVPKKGGLKKVLSPYSRCLKLAWKKDKKAGGYEVQISMSKSFRSKTIKRLYKKGKTDVTLIGLQSKKKYYVRIRSYAKAGKKKVYGDWSKARTVKIR